MVTGIVIPHETRLERFAHSFTDLTSYQATVGGYIEPITIQRPPMNLFANEEGKVQNLPVNRRATCLWWLLSPEARGRDILVGDINNALPLQAGFMATGATSDPWEIYARELGINVARAREVSGLSQERVAHAAGISTFTYRKLEKGESNPGTPANPRLKTLVALCDVLGSDLVDLLPRHTPDIAVGR